ncbi:hypothetical protein [Acetanaerobacterium elongatum]|uniref:Uncharacterized protein n=1 Tax=Acetanaerobacterium elongatum TaxID=258515 RepID=A0A1H0ELF9_9FIRM|nr:hypothetical protein [Acetanaerobacterium elongatum]SDN83136.1 hypothetical protein SAMN05192585_13422 [Acetanaerobacterium elongatum]
MFETLIQQNIEAAGMFAKNRQKAVCRVKERQEQRTDGVVQFRRVEVPAEPFADIPKGPAPAQHEPVIAFAEDSADTPPIKAERSALPQITQIAQAAAKMLAREDRRFDRMLTL